MKTVMCYTAGQTTKGAVAIRKPAGAGNGYRVCWGGAFRKYESPVPPLCGDTGPEKRLKVFSGSVVLKSFFLVTESRVFFFCYIYKNETIY